ncbi:hypothetical protein [Parashewanella tropica]|uniref:hypothetical protein n=1 Tax=Parashewanella tropica TaxID=2547970 RepID=UPI0010594034|nr:hypothetical protein [Parashewanella tropica]
MAAIRIELDTAVFNAFKGRTMQNFMRVPIRDKVYRISKLSVGYRVLDEFDTLSTTHIKRKIEDFLNIYTKPLVSG